MYGVDDWIRQYIRSNACKALVDNPEFDINPPVTLTYAVERLIITHIKLWKLEDEVRDSNLPDEVVGKLKRKIDHLNGVQRPRLVASLGELISKAIKDNDDTIIREPDTKSYQPRENNV